MVVDLLHCVGAWLRRVISAGRRAPASHRPAQPGSYRGVPLLALVLALPAWAGLNIQHWTTPQGAKVVFVENHDLPMLDISVDFPAGSARDSAARSGLASLTRHVMGQGAGPWSERDISERLADVGAQLGGRLDGDRAGFQLRTLSGKAERDQAVETLAMILTRPRFDPAVLEREKTRAIAGMKEALTKPDVIGARAFSTALYGSHPYGLDDGGEIETVAKLNRDDLWTFHTAHYRAAGMTIALMGDIRRADAETLATQLATGLPAGAAPAPIPPVQAAPQGSEQVIPHHATQSHLFMGLPTYKRDDPDYFPLYVGNYILGGGGFDSRLMETIRQKKGLAYSVYSYFSPMREAGPFQIGLQTRRETTKEAVDSVRAELARFLAEGVTDKELAQAKGNIIGGFPLRIDNNRKILEYLAVIGFYGLPLDWLDTYSAQVETVTREAILKAFQRRIRPEALHTVIVGGQIEGPAK
ncbi:MAG: insulinase family protein [Betaproteobacteria bacterium]|nr:insulinase family protein [Betaproteobacteria bacterium]